MKKETTAYKVVLLSVLCAICGFVLSFVNQITAPKIEAAALAQVNASLEEIYPNGSFEVFEDFEDESKTIQDAYLAKGQGMVFKLKVTGYNADGFTFLVAFNNDGSVQGFVPLQQNETAGFGERCFQEEYVNSVLALTSNDSVDVLSGATLTSSAIQEGFDAARRVFNDFNGIETKEVEAKVVEAKAVSVNLSDAFEENGVTVEEVSNDGSVAVYHCTAKGFGLIDPNGMASATEHDYARNVANITVDLETMRVSGIELESFGDTEGFGDKAVSVEALASFVGTSLEDSIDCVAKATYTSKSIASMVHASLEYAKNGGIGE